MSLFRLHDPIRFVLHGENILVVTSSIGAALGAAFGALIIPLDWNVSWQAWPIPNAIGTVIGQAAGLVLGELVMMTRPLLQRHADSSKIKRID